MFTSTGLFRDTPCPQGQKCVLLRCIFSHQINVNGDTSEVIQEAATRVDGDPTSEPALKRRRINNIDHASGKHIEKVEVGLKVSNPRPSKQSKTPDELVKSIRNKPLQSHPKETKDGKDGINFPSATRSISPPAPRRHKAEKRPPDLRSGIKQNHVQSNSEISKAKIPREELNPRTVKPSPATHPVRLAILQQLHKAMVGQNENVSKDPARQSLLLFSAEELITLALDEEERIARDNPAIYSNVIKQRIMKVRKMNSEEWQSTIRLKLAPQSTLNSSQLKPMSNGDLVRPRTSGLTPKEELQILKKLRTPLNGLEKHGYVINPPSEVEIESARSGIKAADGFEKCERCGTRFQVFPGRREDGVLTTHGTCTYHWAKVQRPQWSKMDTITGGTEAFYPCCNESIGMSSGCTTSPHHVFKVTEPKRLASVLQFVRTPSENTDADADATKTKGAVTFDCEMGYTTMGMELIRLTAVTWPRGQELLDVLVRPIGEILDLNTRFSGVTAEQMTNAIPFGQQTTASNDEVAENEDSSDKVSEEGEIESEQHPPLKIAPSPAAARHLLFDLLNPDTPLIGHAIDNDLNASRIIHPFVIDTVLLFPHPRNLPIRYSLKMLASKYLERDIQTSGAQGHDSKEDAIATGDLVRVKVTEKWKQLKNQGWKFDNGTLTKPELGDFTVPLEAHALAGEKRNFTQLEEQQV